MNNPDTSQRFIFEDRDTRGELVHLDNCFQEALKRCDYPHPIRNLIGEAMVAATMLSATLKFVGKLSLQIQGEGALNILLVQIDQDYKIRAMANWSGDIEHLTFPDLMDNAKFVIIIDPDKGDRYLGIVPLEKDNLSRCLEDYFVRSEQLKTKIWFAVTAGHACGLFLQRLPTRKSEDSSNDWEHLVALASTITKAEMLDLPNEELLYRLFHQEKLRVFDTDHVVFFCACSKERCESAIVSLGYKEIDSMIRENETVEINCEFCNKIYQLDIVDLARLRKMANQNIN